MKYVVRKTDGSSIDPEACYFVLRLDTDDAARKAATTYAAHCNDKDLAHKLKAAVAELEAPCSCRSAGEQCQRHPSPFSDVWRYGDSGVDGQSGAHGRAEPSFQARVQPWMLACFGAEISADKQERNHRFLEECLELVQACGATQSEAHQLVDYVYRRTVGEKSQEVGGVMVTLAALCLAHGLDMHRAAEVELARIWTKMEQIRAKQAAKPAHLRGPNDRHSAPSPADAPDD